MEKANTIAVLDKLILGCVVIFLVSLNNSIFINQLGYYGGLILLAARYFVSKENKFRKTGLEILFLLFLLAEIISTILSINKPLAFNNLLKRILLIPIVYTIVAATEDLEKAKLFFKIYLWAAFITILAYIVFAYEHFISQLYQIESKGPSPFQYVMTAGGLISFTTIFFFALLVNEKTKIWEKLFYVSGFIISSLALFASYTRAAWIGTAAGILLILIIKKKWLMLGAIIVFVVTFAFMQTNKSSISVYSYLDGKLHLERMFATQGRAQFIYPEGKKVFVSDYQKGVFLFDESEYKNILQVKSPIASFLKWKDDYYLASLSDYRLRVFRKVNQDKFIFQKEFLSPGLTYSSLIANGNFYVADVDSGLTIFTNPTETGQYHRFPELKNIRYLAVDSTNLACYTVDNLLMVYQLQNGLPAKKIFNKKIITNFGFLSLVNNYLLFSTGSSVKLLKIDLTDVKEIDDNILLKKAFNFISSSDKYFITDFSGKLYELEYPIRDKIKIINTSQLPFAPFTAAFENNKFYFSEVKLSRLNSIIDPYHITNVQREYQWQAGYRIWKDYPFFGVGDIDMHPVYKKYMNYFEKETFGHLHNNYVQLLAALGIFGFLIVMALLLKILLTHIKIYKQLKSIQFASSYSLGALAVFVGFLVSGLAEWNFGDHEIITMVWFTLGLNLAFYKTALINNNLTGSNKI
ncbi:MAG: O-antigen ligase family protein [Ignavibacteriales bacterium]|nr:O-antigen ligase family protein [Ignavibacteriales bacterium]